MNPAFPDEESQRATGTIDRRARVWIVERGEDGGLEERLDPDFLASLEESEDVDEILEALIAAAAAQDVAQTRIW